MLDRLEPERNEVIFHSASGPLTVRRAGKGYVMDFPARTSDKIATPPALTEAIGVEPLAVYSSSFNYMAVLKDADQVRTLNPDFAAIAKLDRPGVIVTAAGDEDFDFISRYFAPAKGINEDPVTGSAHCMLAPYWAEKLAKTDFRAYQASPRGGEVLCRLLGDRVELQGCCVFYLQGEAVI